jgi:hypothetical protein
MEHAQVLGYPVRWDIAHIDCFITKRGVAIGHGNVPVAGNVNLHATYCVMEKTKN